MFDRDELAKFPTDPGVYLMRDADGDVLYVGKAINLRNRVKQYFSAGGDSRPQIPYLIAKIESIDTIIVNSEKEALILENNLIKQHQPKYNIFLKDDKGYVSLKLTNHRFPKIELIRTKGVPPPDGRYFGPYTSSYAAKQMLELLIRIFPLRRCTDRELASRLRPCILHDMKRCIAPCVDKCTTQEYGELVDKVKRFLLGKDRELIDQLYAEMNSASEKLEFERAGEIYSTIKAIERTLEQQSVEQVGGTDCDALGIYREGGEVSLTQLQFRSGKLLGSQNFHFSSVLPDDPELLSSFLLQHYAYEAPPEILLPSPTEDPVHEILSARILTPKRGRKHDLIAMAQANAASAFHRTRDRRALLENMLIELEEKLHLMNYPRRIECVDNSNLSGSEPVAALIAYTDGEKDKKRYRKYKLKTGSDDYAAMREVLTRRLKKGDLPDLLILDGGKGQVSTALQVLQSLNIVTLDVIGLSKEAGRHDRGDTSETIHLANGNTLTPKRNAQLLYFLQKVRDEAHRFAITFQKKRREKTLLRSELDKIPGIGPKKKRALLQHFGSVKRIFAATEAELREISGITSKDIKNLRVGPDKTTSKNH